MGSARGGAEGTLSMWKRLSTLRLFSALAWAGAVMLAAAASAGPLCECGDADPCGTEACDDGNTVEGDGCDNGCQIEECGNGFPPQAGTTPPEECDDANTVDDDGCTYPDCQFDCGDGEIDPATTPPETCEDGNGTNGDGCDDDAANDGNCTDTRCGNGVVTTGEDCDDGNTVDDETCLANCTAPCAPTSKSQQACVNSVNGNGAGVLKARNADNATCYKAAAAEKESFDACFGDDLKGMVAKAQAKTTATIASKKCTGASLPTFAFTDAATVNAGANTASNDAVLFVFGAAPVIAPKKTEKENAACQAAAVVLLNKQLDTVAKEANKAKKTALKGGKRGTPAPVCSNAELADAIDAALSGNGKILAAAGKIASTLGKKCTDGIVDANFDCGGLATSVASLATCIETTALRAACQSMEAADGIDLVCAGD
jgi:cysteine-rich repeat protein